MRKSKKLTSLALALILMFAFVPMIATINAEDNSIIARPTQSRIIVDGEQKSFDAYNINGNNFFKLRDLAYILNGTSKQFAVEWDGVNNAISLISGKAYTIVGGEMTGKGEGNKIVNPTSSELFIDGEEILLTAYHIEGNNYFKLREIAAIIDFEVDWSEAERTATITDGDVKLSLREGGNTITITRGNSQEEITLESRVTRHYNRLFVPLRAIAEALRKEVFFDRGLIIISEKNLFDAQKDREVLDAVCDLLGVLPTVGNAENLERVLNEMNSSWYDTVGIDDWDMVDAESVVPMPMPTVLPLTETTRESAAWAMPSVNKQNKIAVPKIILSAFTKIPPKVNT